MKVAFICDTHFGVRNDSPFFLENAIAIFEEQFFPYLKENNIRTVIHLGDLFDRRKYINFNTLSTVRDKFFQRLHDEGIHLHITIGNHDTYYKNTNNLNSIKEILEDRYLNVSIYEKPSVIYLNGYNFGIVPWITKENEEEVQKFIQTTNCKMIGGHFEIVGFQVINGVYHTSGFKVSEFNRFERVLSGHFHIKQSMGNIHYLGTAYQMNFADVYSKKGFHVFDTESNTLEFIENDNEIFHLFTYDDSSDEEIKKIAKFINEKKLKGTFVKVNIRVKDKQVIFDKFIDALWEKGIQNLSVLEDSLEINSDVQFEESDDTMSIIGREIVAIERDFDKVKLKTLISDLYMESLKV